MNKNSKQSAVLMKIIQNQSLTYLTYWNTYKLGQTMVVSLK